MRERCVIVVGATGAIGSAVCDQLEQQGVTVSRLDRPGTVQPPLTEIDVRDQSTLVRAAALLRAQRANYDGVVYAVGIETHSGPIATMSVDDFDLVQRVNVTGFFLTLKHLAPLIRDAGSVVAIGSTSGLMGHANVAAYVTSKHALIGLMRCAAIELAPRRIRVNCVAPGPLESPMMAAFEAAHRDGSVRSWYEQHTPLGRLGKLDEVAALIAFLLSDEAAFISGGIYMCDGGLTAAGRVK
jgi:NAD(P)-dependent dehydrogenase (short-subunit alcohol dehydrogenase family)